MSVEAPKRLVVTTAAACRAELHEWCNTDWCDCSCHPDEAGDRHEDGDDPGQCNWFFDDGEESYAEYRPHEFSGAGRTCINCGAPNVDANGDDEP